MGLLDGLYDGTIDTRHLTDEQYAAMLEELNAHLEAIYNPDLSREQPVVDETFDGYYFKCHSVCNGFGGYHSVNLTINHDVKGLHRQITDEKGWFLEFPGTRQGAWMRKLAHPFREQIEFTFSAARPSHENDLLDFRWMVQPDGRYYADEYGFGMTKDEEIVLVAGMDREGRFTEQFHIE